MLDPTRLAVFRSVLASGSIQAASTHLGYTPSAVSQQIAALQRETGLRLFEREGRGIVPTPAAHVLAEHSADVLKHLSELDTVVAQLRDGRTGRFTIGYFASAGTNWMPNLVKALRADFPDVTIDLVLTEQPSDAVLDIDLVLRRATTPVPEGYRKTDLLVDPYVVLVSAEHPLARRDRIEVAELAGETFISNGPAGDLCVQITTDACTAAGFVPRYHVQAQDHYTAIAFVEAGLGVTMMPGLAARVVPSGVCVLPIADPAPERHIAVLRRQHSSGPKAIAERAVQVLLDLATNPRPDSGFDRVARMGE